MTFDEAFRFLTDSRIQRIAQDQTRTVHQRAADIAALDDAKPAERKERKQRKPKADAETSGGDHSGEGLI